MRACGALLGALLFTVAACAESDSDAVAIQQGTILSLAAAADQRLDLDAEISVATGFRRRECEYWWSVYDEAFRGGE